MNENDLNVLIHPTTKYTAPEIPLKDKMNNLTLSLPSAGLPIGMSIVAKRVH